MLTTQQIFDKAVSGVIKQGEPAAYDGLCSFRTPNGCKCAVGQLIDDDVYSVVLEKQGIESSAVLSALAASGVDVSSRQNVAILSQLRTAHDRAAWGAYFVTVHDDGYDNARFVELFKRECADVAKRFSLDSSVCEA